VCSGSSFRFSYSDSSLSGVLSFFGPLGSQFPGGRAGYLLVSLLYVVPMALWLRKKWFTPRGRVPDSRE